MEKFLSQYHLQSWPWYGLFAVALLGDSAIGLLLLSGAGLELLWLHIPGVLLCVLSIQLISKRSSQQDPAQRNGPFRLNRWSVTALLLCLIAFPGFGTLTYAIALVAGKFMPQGRIAEESDDTLPEEQNEPTLDMQVQPLVDVLKTPDLDMRRAAVTVLGHLSTPEAIASLRQLLSDPQAEIRSDASIILTRLEDELAHGLNDALGQWKTQPQDREVVLNLANQYYRYASSNVLDKESQRAYLEKARDLLLQIIALDQTCAELWMKLARIRQHLGETAEALIDASSAIQLQPTEDAYMLAIELSFQLRSWNTFFPLTSAAMSALAGNPESAALLAYLQWWGTKHVYTRLGARHEH